MGEVKKIKFKSKNVKKILLDFVLEIFANFKEESLPERVNIIKDKLDEKFDGGWNVWCGKHITGVCTYITHTFIEFEHDEVFYTIYQTYTPK
ncbi:hypothetical protein A0H76_91 [Hepatospora eriocheir]|uniref:Dynein light chain n=1 Tax=Hepatospora eriocheir TaxID=1081669 RepID=A0A1X0QJ98_9MICR|nr:hypothetical protein A0H76_91 [Hepatospora eriocheir]